MKSDIKNEWVGDKTDFFSNTDESKPKQSIMMHDDA